MYELFVQILTIARGMWRFRWYSLVVAYIVCIIGWIVVYQMPDRYESSAKVYVETQSVLQPLLEGLAVDTDVLTKVDMLTRSLTSRPSIESLIRETDMDLRVQSSAEMESLVTFVAGKILIERPNKSFEYTLSYSDVDPVMAQKVVQTLLNALVEKTMGSSREDTLYAQKFLVKQIGEYEERLTQAEQRLAEFKKQNVGLMPGQGGGYYDRLQSSVDALDDINSKLRIAENRRSELQKQLRGEKAVIGNTELDARIQEKSVELNNLLLKYTEQHPDVLALRETIAQLQAQKQTDKTSGQSVSGDDASLSPVYQSIKIAISETEVEIATLKSQAEYQKKEIAEFKNLVDTIPEVEANLARLNRDYNVTKTQYEALLERLESARLSEGAELSKDEIKFRVIEPPILPLKPSEPNRLLFLSMVLLIGLGAGLGLAYLFNDVKPVFSTAEELGHTTGLPVLGVVSIKLSDDKAHLIHVNLLYLIGVAASLMLIYLIVLVMA